MDLIFKRRLVLCGRTASSCHTAHSTLLVVALGEFGQHPQIVGLQHRAGGVMRRVDHDHPRARRDAVGHPLPVNAIARRQQRQADRSTAGERHRRLVAVVGGVEHDDLVARLHHRGDGAVNGLGGARRDGDLGIR